VSDLREDSLQRSPRRDGEPRQILAVSSLTRDFAMFCLDELAACRGAAGVRARFDGRRCRGQLW
jgi:hypothetical protein